MRRTARWRGGAVLNVMLMLVLGGLIGLHWVVRTDASRRNYEFLPDMVESVAHDAQTAAPLLADGTAIDLRPPADSIVRGYLPFDYPATPAGALLAGAELENPVAPDDADAATRGAFVFATFCAVCHGAAGLGDGVVTKRGVPPPPSLLAEHALQMSDGQMYHVLSLGQGNMASYAAQVSRDDRWRAIRHIRKLQSAGPAATDAVSVLTATEND